MTQAKAAPLPVGRLPSPAFWRSKKVFLTGHTGFKGGWLSVWLAQMGASVQGYALPPATNPNFFDLLGVANLIGHEIGDVRDAAQLRAAIDRFAPDIIIHMAAQPLVLESYETPKETFETNVMGTVNVLDAAWHCDGVQVTLIVTSDKCYENDGTPRAYQETDRLGGHDPYSSSKACAELATTSYARSFFSDTAKSLASVRAGNVIGGGDWSPDRLMTDVITALIAGSALVLRSPNAVRPWQHVLEPLSGYLLAAEHLFEAPSAGKAWNFGPRSDDVATTEVLTSLVCQAWGGGIKPIAAMDHMPDKEALYLALDSSKAKNELEWSPGWDLHQAIQKTVDWYRAWYDSDDMQQVTHSQISAYVGAHVVNK
jgi:CDP-glucose 4,6-dehydratase